MIRPGSGDSVDDGPGYGSTRVSWDGIVSMVVVGHEDAPHPFHGGHAVGIASQDPVDLILCDGPSLGQTEPVQEDALVRRVQEFTTLAYIPVVAALFVQHVVAVQGDLVSH